MRTLLKVALPWILLSLLILIPLYAVSVAFGIRSGVFDLRDTEIGADEYKALWAFIASGLATAVTVVGLLFSRSHNERISRQLELDTAVKGLELIASNDGEYAPKARIAGALATLVHLGHPVIAMRTLGAVWEADAVDPATACWLISEVFTGGTDSSKIEAAGLLRHNAAKLAHDDPTGSAFEWPPALYRRWPKDLPREARLNNVRAVVQLVLSKDRKWWHGAPLMAVGLLDEAFRKDSDWLVRETSGQMLRALLQAVPQDASFAWGRGLKEVSEIRKGVSSFRFGMSSRAIDDVIREIEAWIGSGAGETDTSTGHMED